MMAANMGTLLGNFVGAIMRTLLTDEELIEWGWRIPFLSGILIGFVGIYLRLHGREHNPNVGEYGDDEGGNDSGEPKNPLSEVFKKENLPALGSATFTPMLWGAGFYTSTFYRAFLSKDFSLDDLKRASSFSRTIFRGMFSLCLDGHIYESSG